MTPYYSDDLVTLHHGDCLGVLPTLPDASVDSVVTDPPYELGFMGKGWDATGIAYNVTVWRECLRVLKPGGHLLAFGGSRTWHRLAVAIEDAGFELRDSIAWLYGSGFPKSLDVSKAIDKAAGAEREVIGRTATPFKVDAAAHRGTSLQGSVNGDFSKQTDEDGYRYTKYDTPATPDAERWQGWGTALKPGHESVVCARKPFNTVPLGEEVDRLHHLIGGLLWLSLSPAKRAELTSPSSPAGQPAGTCVSALVSAALDTSPEASDQTATFNSPALASTSSSIASSWSATLGALSARMRTSTTSTASSTTTALRTLNSLLGPITLQTTMPKCGCLLGGPSSPAPSVASSSSDEWARWLHTLSASVPATATEGIALAVASALAQVAGELSDAQAEASSASSTATTGAAASRSAFEPVVVARKPFKGTVASNVLAWGTGALNIDGCRVGDGGQLSWAEPRGNGYMGGGSDAGTVAATESTKGRWPANVVLDEHAAAELDRQSGIQRDGVAVNRNRAEDDRTSWYGTRKANTGADVGYGGHGGASRFFYVAKAPTSERPRVDGIAHPTVKPLNLMRWLVRLVTPPGGTVLEPFAGSGTTAEACVLEGFQCVAIEREADYLPLIVSRLNQHRGPR